MGGRAKFFKLLASEDVGTDKMDLGVTVLASLGGGHVDDLAGAALDDDDTVLAQSRALHGEGLGRTGIATGLDLELHGGVNCQHSGNCSNFSKLASQKSQIVGYMR